MTLLDFSQVISYKRRLQPLPKMVKDLMRSTFLVLAAAVAAPAASVAAAPAAAAVLQEASERDRQVVCRGSYSSASRMGTRERVCRTRAQWRALSRSSQRTAGEDSQSGTGRSNTPSSATVDPR